MEEIISKAATLLEALPYIQRFRSQIFVVKYGGSFMDSPDAEVRHRVARDVVFLEAVGINPVVVHGGGKAITRALETAGVKSAFVQGHRVTDAATAKIVDRVLSREINPEIVKAIQDFGGKARGFAGSDIFRCRKLSQKDEDGQEVDLGFVGEVVDLDVEPLRECIRRSVTPVISPTARGPDGEIYNCNADIAAARTAIALKARRLVFMSDVPGLLRDPKDDGTLMSHLSAAEVPRAEKFRCHRSRNDSKSGQRGSGDRERRGKSAICRWKNSALGLARNFHGCGSGHGGGFVKAGENVQPEKLSGQAAQRSTPNIELRTLCAKDSSKFVVPSYARFDLVLERGEGSYVWDIDGGRYLDLAGGIAVCSLGHAHPEITKALTEQSRKLIHVSNLYYNELQGQLAKRIVDLIAPGRVFFCNSGAEANEGLFKLARKFGHDEGRFEIITTLDSFHGRTLAGIAATGQEKVKKGFEPRSQGLNMLRSTIWKRCGVRSRRRPLPF